MEMGGEQHFTCSSAEALGILKQRAGALPDGDLHAAREFLIQCGQFEQGCSGAAECFEPTLPASAARLLTNFAAHVFLARFKGVSDEHFYTALASALQQLSDGPDLELKIQVPHAFALQGLFPEQHLLAAEKFISAHPGLKDQAFAVIGDLQTGTILTAIVRAVLTDHGLRANRHNFRLPPGVESKALSTDLHINASYALIVDDGPGFSGSRAAALAEAAMEHGIPRRHIFFLPADAAPPGSLTTEVAREWWTGTPRFAVSTEEISWQGRSLAECLRLQSEEWMEDRCTSVHDLGAGAWREMVWVDPELWPPVMPSETPKFLCRTLGGKGIFWKFSGLGSGRSFATSLAEDALERISELAEKSWTASPLGSSHGFIAVPWVQGQRLTARDIDYPLLNQLANYLINASLAPLQPRVALAQFEHLQRVIIKTTAQALPDDIAQEVADFARTSECPLHLPTSGDGRLAPHEWIRTDAGNILKLDCAGHRIDRTCLGPQSIAWDFAGLIAEWNMPGAAQVQLLQQLSNADILITRRTLSFYLLAYLGWKWKWHAFSIKTLTRDPMETKRHEKALQTTRVAMERVAGNIGPGGL